MLKKGTDDILLSLWEFSSRNPSKMERNCGNLCRFVTSDLEREFGNMDGLEDYLDKRGIRPFRFLGQFFKYVADMPYMKFGKYTLGSTPDCLASIEEVYGKTLKCLDVSPAEDERTSHTQHTQHTQRTWTNMGLAAGSRGAKTSAQDERDREREGRSRDKTKEKSDTFITSHTSKKSTAREGKGEQRGDQQRGEEEEGREKEYQHNDQGTQMSVRPDDSVSNIFQQQHSSSAGRRQDQGNDGGSKREGRRARDHGEKKEEKQEEEEEEEEPREVLVTKLTQAKLAQLQNGQGMEYTYNQKQSTPHLSAGGGSRSAVRSATPLKPEHMKPLRPSLRVARAPVRYSHQRIGPQIASFSMRSVREVGGAAGFPANQFAHEYAAKPPSVLQTHRPSFPNTSSKLREKLSQIHSTQYAEPPEYSRIDVHRKQRYEHQFQRKKGEGEERGGGGGDGAPSDFVGGAKSTHRFKDLKSAVFQGAEHRLHASIQNLKRTGLIREDAKSTDFHTSVTQASSQPNLPSQTSRPRGITQYLLQRQVAHSNNNTNNTNNVSGGRPEIDFDGDSRAFVYREDRR
jgi:hypothetical protein